MPNSSPPCSPKSRLLNRIRRTRLESTLKSAGPAWYRRSSQVPDPGDGVVVETGPAGAGEDVVSGVTCPELSGLAAGVGTDRVVALAAPGAASKTTEARSTG